VDKPLTPPRRLAVDDWELRTGRNDDSMSGLASLPDKSIDVGIMDPPYEAEAHTAQRRQKVSRGGLLAIVGAPLKFPPITEAEREEVSRQMARVVMQRVLVFCQVEAVHLWRGSLERAGLRYKRSIPWVKPDAMPSLHGRWPGQSFESIVLAVQPRSERCPIGGKAVYYEFPRAQNKVHDTAKPLPLMRALVTDFSLPGELVCDPYAGSGTTGVACRMLGRRFIGWESDVTMAEIARRRIAGDRAILSEQQMEMF
jgi:site-specific DNA-methyltransferase (adenine-specific)